MAAHYVREIRELRPEGPYQVGGHSLGGWIAYEIAQQLRRQSQSVAVLLFDTYPHCRVPWPASGIAALIQARDGCRWAAERAGHHLHKITGLTGCELLPYVLRRADTFSRSLCGRPLTRQSPAPAASAPTADAVRPRRPPDYYQQTVARYEPRPFDGHVHLFQASRPPVPLLPAFWRRIAKGGVTVHRVPFGHNDMLLADNAPVMARLLAAALATR